MKKMQVLIGAVAVVAGAFFVAYGFSGTAASDEYKFLVRGIVKEVALDAEDVNVYITHASAEAKSDLAGNRQDFDTSAATFYEWDGAKKVKVDLDNVNVGEEIVMRGAKKTNGQYNVSKLWINDRSFEVVGKLKEHDKNDMRIKVLVGTSTYKQSQYVDKEVWMIYDETTEFMSLGNVIESDDLSADNQQIKVKGKIVNTSQWELTNVWDNY